LLLELYESKLFKIIASYISGHRLIHVLQETIHFIFYYLLLIYFSLMNYWPF